MMRFLALFPLLAGSLLAQQTPAAWRLSPTPILRLGGPEGTGATEFANPYDAAFWGQRLVVLDGGSQTLRVFHLSDGRHLDTYGRRGNGPGEYSNAAYLQPIPGDSLFISDLQQSRYTILDSGGRVARVISFANLRAGVRSAPLGRLRDGSILAWVTRFDAATREGLQPIHTLILRVNPDGTRGDSLRLLPFTTVQPLSVGGRPGWRVAFGAGQLQPAIWDQGAFFNSPTQYLFYVLGENGRWSTIEQPVVPRLRRPKDAEAIRERAIQDGALPQLMAQVQMVDTLPALGLPRVTASGLLFAVDGPIDSAQKRRGVTVFSAGNAIGRFYFPSQLDLLAVSDTLVVFTERDPADGPSIMVYRLLR